MENSEETFVEYTRFDSSFDSVRNKVCGNFATFNL